MAVEMSERFAGEENENAGTLEEAIAAMRITNAVLGNWEPRQRRAILQSWVEQVEAKQGHESNLTAWLKAIAQALEQGDACPHDDDPLNARS